MNPVELTNDNASPMENLAYTKRQIEWANQAGIDMHWRYKFEANEIVIRDNRGCIPGLRFRFKEDLAACSKEDRLAALESIKESLTNMFPLTVSWEMRPNMGE